MDRAEHARFLAAYEGWANQRILSNLFDLDEDTTGSGASWGTIFGSMEHVVGSQAVWLGRFTGDGRAVPTPTNLSDLESAFRHTQAELASFTAAMSDADWGRLVRFSDSRGNPHEEYLGILLTHVVNHGTYHRGEAAMLLTRAGRSPGDLDMIVYRRQMEPGR